MKSLISATLAGVFAIATSHAAEIGKPAPAFTAKNVKGEEVSLTDSANIEGADKLFATALDAVMAGNQVANAKNEPYGCGVKY
ncbi:MAG: hypothetical protein IZT59_10085 [Verrucomicrobia bacterium]|jgi:hypothetical protein|nr:hypothetical protein [Verrucomicrobiota bacterium]|tara:strand:+ start:4723 stop:4971 length:249 start_codon:yes stop_codon:yes gene_type:complete